MSAYLSARNDRVVFEATRVLAMLSTPPQAHRHTIDPTSMAESALPRTSSVRRKLLAVAQARGVASSSLDVVDFLFPPAAPDVTESSTFQFYRTDSDTKDTKDEKKEEEEETKTHDTGDDDASAHMVTIPLPALPATARTTDAVAGDASDPALLLDSAYAAATAFDAVVQQYNVPARLHFELYTKIRSEYALRSSAAREAIVVECLYANVVLFNAFSESWDVTSYVEQNPELTRAIAELVRVELFDKVPLRVRVVALQVLTALVYDRGGRTGGAGVLGRQSNVLTALGVVKGTPHGVFPALIRFCMSELGTIAPASAASSHASAMPAAAPSSSASALASETDSDMDMSLAVAFVHATTDELSSHEAQAVAKPASRTASTSVQDAKLTWVEAVLGLLGAVVSIQLGAAVLTENGVVPALLHVVTVASTSQLHAGVTTQCVQALEMTVSNHTAGAALYRDLNGVGILIDRLAVECASVSGAPRPLAAAKNVLIAALLEALSVSFHSQGVMSAGATSRVIRDGSVLSKVLVKILSHVDAFGSVVFAQAAILVSDIINNDPSSVNHVHSGGIADAFLKTLTRWDVTALHPANVLPAPCSELLMAVPSVLNALCLTSVHAEKVAKHEPLLHLIDMFALPAYAAGDESSDGLQSEVASVVGGGVFEIMRHLSSFQTAAIHACVHAVKKVVRFGDERVTPATESTTTLSSAASSSAYATLLRMATHVADLLEPILSKSEYATAFADQGGVALLFQMYRLILPTTTSFLSSAFATADNRESNSKSSLSHHAAAQSITLALRAYAAQQPTLMLSALVKELSRQLDGLQRARAVIGLPWFLSESGEGAEGVLCALPDVELAELFGDHGSNPSAASASKLGSVGEYLRVLSTVEWLSSLLVWTLQTAQTHLQSRRWFTEFANKPTQLVIARLFGVDRSVQFERASLAALHKQQQQQHTSEAESSTASTTAASSKSDAPAKHLSGLWKVGSLLLLRFTIVMRSLLTAFGKALLATPLQHRRGDDAVVPLAPHAATLAATVMQVLERHVMYMVEPSRATQIDAYVQQYYLTFFLETLVTVVFDGKKKQANTLLLVELLKPLKQQTASANPPVAPASADSGSDVVMTATTDAPALEQSDVTANASCLLHVVLNVAEQFFQRCLNRPATPSEALSRMDMTSFRIAATALRRFSDLESISASPLTAALIANDDSSDAVDLGSPFAPRTLTVQLHQLCVNVVLSIWCHPSFAALPADGCISEILLIVVTMLKTRLDQAEAAPELGSSGISTGDADFDFLAGVRRHGLGFGRGRSSSSGGFDDETLSLRNALFGGGATARRPSSRHTFVPDANIVESLTAMGFPRPRVELALRRTQINDVELAMEWILSHPDDDDDDGDDDDIESRDESTASDATETRPRGDSEAKKRETALFEAYTKLRDSFEDGCFAILDAHAALPAASTRSGPDDLAFKPVYPQQRLVQSIAEYFVALCARSDDEQDAVVARVNRKVLTFFASDSVVKDMDESVYTMTTHLLALVLQLHPTARDVALRQTPSCLGPLLKSVAKTTLRSLNSDAVALNVSCAPVLLTLDALVGSSHKPTASTARSDATGRPADATSSTSSTDTALPANVQHDLVDVCLQLLTILGREAPAGADSSHRDRYATIAHAAMQLLAHVTLEYDVAHAFFSRGGVDLVLNLRREYVFMGYQDLVCTLLSQVLESPDVLQQMMEEKILRALSKLSARLGSPSQMRITPRALLMELAPVASRNEEVFVKALEHAVQVKKSESGRTYVVPKESAPEPSQPTPSSDAPAATSSDLTPSAAPGTDAKNKKTASHSSSKVPKSHKQALKVICSKLIAKIRTVWNDEQQARDAAQTLAARTEPQMQPVVCVGMYVEFLVHVVTAFPTSATVLAKATDPAHAHAADRKHSFVRLLLRELLPSKDLCRFAAQRRSLKESGLYGTSSAGLSAPADLPLATERAFLSAETKERVQSAHRLLNAIVEQSNDGAKYVVVELIQLLHAWLEERRAASGHGMNVHDDASLSALHAWAGLIMTISWPHGSAKGFAWDKIGPAGGAKRTHAFVTLLADALRTVDLAHPFAHVTCSMVLRPLATLTRAFVTDRVRRAHKKQHSSGATATTAAAPDATTTPVPSAPARGDTSVSSASATVATVPEQQATAPSATVSTDTATPSSTSVITVSSANADDVTMRTPTTSNAGDDHEMRDAADASDDDDESDRSSDSERSIDDENDDDDDEEEEEEDEDEDDEDDDEDDDDEDDDDDEREDEQLRLRVIRGSGGNTFSRRSSNRLWGSLDSDLSMIDALDEVDEEDYSYLNILDDEALFTDEQHRRAQLVARTRESTSSTNASNSDATVNSLLDAFMGHSSERRALGAARTSGVESEEYPFDLPSSELFRDTGAASPSQDRQGMGVFRNAVMQFIDDLPDGGDDDVLFESFEMGHHGARARARDRASNRLGIPGAGLSTTHPLLRSSGSSEFAAESGGLRIPARLSLPRHSSLLRELQELSDHVQTHLPVTFGNGARARLGMPRSGSGRHRPPSRSSRLSAVSNLLSEFSLDIPASSHLSLSQARSHRLGQRGAGRGDHDIFGTGSRGLRGDVGGASSAAIWGPGGIGRDVDVRSIASRLEQRINQMYVEDDASAASVAPRASETAASARQDDEVLDDVGERERAADTSARSDSTESAGVPAAASAAASSSSPTDDDETLVHDQGAGNDHETETASVLALASTFGESTTIRSPEEPDADQTGSETEAAASPMVHDDEPAPGTAVEQASVAPPPAPVTAAPAPSPAAGSMLSFTLDLSGLQVPPPPSSTTSEAAQSRSSHMDDESKSDEPPATTSAELQCPEGIDPEVFASLPPDMQAEIVAQSAPPAPPARATPASETQSGSESFSQLDLDMANSSFDRETLEALPADIRAEVLANERREREALAAAAAAPADISRAQEMDNASFVASLAPDLREEILVTCDDAFLQTLSSQVRAEAMILRERAAFRTTYRERPADPQRTTGARNGGDGISDLFQRPTLRRMLTSHGPDGLGSGSTRRSSRRNVYLDSSGNVRRSSRRDGTNADNAAHAGMLRVDHDEDESPSDRIVDDKCVQALLRLLFMTQSVIQNRVLQRVLANICVYPLTRASVRVNALRVITRALAQPLELLDTVDDAFPPARLIGCASATASRRNGVKTEGSGGASDAHAVARLPADVLTRMLHVLVSLAKYNPRFAVELLRAHGMRRSGDVTKSLGSSESGASVLVELLTVPFVCRNGTNLDTLLELLELVLSPLDRLAAPKRTDKDAAADETKTNDDDAAPKRDESEWVVVPTVEFDAAHMTTVVSVLCMDICSPQMQERTVNVLKLLNRVPANRARVIDAIVHHASLLARTSKAARSGASAFESSAVLRSAQDELRLLRLLHTLSDICETTSAFTECCHAIGLDPLWDELSRSLEDARSKGGLEESESSALASDATTAGTLSTTTPDDDNVDSMVIEGKSAGASCAMAALLARFLPMVEAFFVVNARDAASMSLQVPDSTEREEAIVANLRTSGFAATAAADSETKPPATDVAATPTEPSESMRLANFVEANRVLLNILVREKPSLLDASLAALIKMSRCRAYLDFDNKRTYFQSAMKKLRQTALRSHGGSNASVRIPVRREHIFEDSYYALRMRSGHELRRKLHISFTGEEGIDAGGVTREWYMILAREIFNPNYVLFTSAADSPTFQPNPLSYVNKDHLSYFEFVGKVIGKAVADSQLLDAHFTRSFYKHMLQLPISYHDMEAIDPEYYRNLHSILDNAIEDLGLELTFSAEQSNFGKVEVVDLIPNGRHVSVTDANKMEYVKLVTHHRMATGIRQQIDAFLKGFHQLVPADMIAIFNENELELLISGMPEIDIDDLKANTDYANYKPTDAVIRWFWNVLYAFTHEERALFLQFVTGTSKVPLEGFKALEGMRGTQKFNVHKAYGNTSALPSAHTWYVSLSCCHWLLLLMMMDDAHTHTLLTCLVWRLQLQSVGLARVRERREAEAVSAARDPRRLRGLWLWLRL